MPLERRQHLSEPGGSDSPRGALLLEHDDEWAERRFHSAESMKQTTTPTRSTTTLEILAAIAWQANSRAVRSDSTT